MRYLIFILSLLPVFCHAQNSGLVIKTGATNQATIQKGATGADSVTLMGVMDTARAKAYLATGANSLRLIGRVVLNSSDSTLYLYNGLGWVRVGSGTTDTTGLSDRIDYNLTRIDGLSDTASLHTDTLEQHKEWLSRIDSEVAAIPTTNDFQTVLDNGNTSNKDFIVERSSYTGYTRIGDGISSFAPPNPSRVSFYVTSKTQGQGAGSGIGYGIQSVAEYVDSVGFLSSTTLIGVKGTATASSSTSSGGLNEHDFTINAAGANMSGLIGEAFTRDSAYTTSAAAVTASAEAFDQSHMQFAANILSIGTKRRTGTKIDSLAGLYIQQRTVLGSGYLGENYGIWIDSMIAGNNNYGIRFKNNPSNGSIATADGHDFSIKPGAGAATKIHSSAYIYDTTFSDGEVYTPNLPRGTQDSIVYIDTDGRQYKGATPTIPADTVPSWQATVNVNPVADSVLVSNKLFVGTTEDYKPISIQVIGDSRDASVFGGIAPLKIWPQRVANLMGANLNQALAQPSTFFMNEDPRFDPLNDTSAVMDVILTDKIKDVTGLSDSDYYLFVTRCINDLHWYTTEDSGYNYTPENFGRDYRIFMDTIVNRGYDMDKVVLMGPKYVLPTSTMVVQDSVSRWIDTVRQVAADYGCKFFDAFHWEEGRGGASLLDIDDFHENETGHAVLAKGMIVTIAAPVKRNGQTLAVNGTLETNRFIFRGGNDSSTANSWVMMVNARGEAFTSGNKVIWNNSPDSLRQEADINVSKIKGRSLEATGINSVSLKIGNNTAIQGAAASGGTVYFDASANTTGTVNVRAGSTTTFNSTEVSSTVPFRSALMWVGTAVQGNSASGGTLYLDASKNTTGTINIRAGSTTTFNSSGITATAITQTGAHTINNNWQVGTDGKLKEYGNATPANGQVLIGDGTDMELATLTAGSGISITNGAGSITIAATGGGGGGDVSFTDTPTIVATKYDIDTVNAKIPDVSGFLVWADSNVLATKYDIDTTNLNIPDVSGFMSWTDTVSDIGTKHDIDTLATSIYAAGYLTAATAASTYVPLTRTINGNALSANVTLDAGDIDPVTNRNYVTDAQAVVIGNTSGTNTGDQTTITGNAGTATALQTGRTIDNTTFDGTANIKLNRPWQGKLAGELDTLTTGVKLTFRMPYACTVTGVKAAVNTASSSGNITIDIHENGTTIMSTNKITIEATETTSLDATTPPTVTDTSIAADALIQVEVDAAGTNAISGEVTIYYTLQ